MSTQYYQYILIYDENIKDTPFVDLFLLYFALLIFMQVMSVLKVIIQFLDLLLIIVL